MAAGRGDLVVALPDLLQRPPLGDDPAGEGDGALLQLSLLRQFVDEAHFQALPGRNVLAGGDHLQGFLNSNDARQALGATGAGQQAEGDFRQAQTCRRHGDAVVTGQRHLEAAAKRRAVDGGDYRLERALDGVLDGEQTGALLRAAEFGDVGPGDEGPALADKDDRLGGRVRAGLLHAAGQAVAHRRREGVHRRRIEGDHTDIALEGVVGDWIDGGHELSNAHGAKPRESAQFKRSYKSRQSAVVNEKGILGRRELQPHSTRRHLHLLVEGRQFETVSFGDRDVQSIGGSKR